MYKSTRYFYLEPLYYRQHTFKRTYIEIKIYI
nr:MAG TPA: hypothetical protein [Caudoviricetes sp.]